MSWFSRKEGSAASGFETRRRGLQREIIAGWLGAARLLGRSSSRIAQRQHQRYQWQRDVTVRSSLGECPARIIDLSVSGMAIVLAQAPGVGDSLEISNDRRRWVRGTVVHVSPAEKPGSFRVGLEFDFV